MRIFNWVQGKLNNSMVSHQRGISLANEIVDTRVSQDSANLEGGLDDILAIGTFGFDQLNLSNSKAEEEEEISDSQLNLSNSKSEEEEIADSRSLVVTCQETEARQETNMVISKPTIGTCSGIGIATANEVRLFDNEMLDNQLDSDDNSAEKKKKMTLADLFLVDNCFFRNTDNVSNIIDVKISSDFRDSCEKGVETVLTTAGATAMVQTKDAPRCSFIKKLPIPCITAGNDSSCLLYSRPPLRKLHRMMAKMLKKKKKIHPTAVQHDGEIADTESKIIKVCH
ncbi:hypothetical protein MKX01_009580 [Papaver californicum]|nr:hypothetical protein MKX01_009580 [Papaver californicum]